MVGKFMLYQETVTGALNVVKLPFMDRFIRMPCAIKQIWHLPALCQFEKWTTGEILNPNPFQSHDDVIKW